MKITHYLYNTFIIESGDKKIAIDPGAELYHFKFNTIIPESEWKDITHIFVTHGDPDHYWHTDRVAEASNAPVICNKTMEPGPKERIGWGDIGFEIKFDKMTIVNLGDTLLHSLIKI